jgi:Uma2 family endonuclease
MSTVGRALVSWEQFLELPDPEPGFHLELHNGEVVLVAPARPLHIVVQMRIAKWLSAVAQDAGYDAQEFPYRPAENLQFWTADVAYVTNEDLRAMRGSEYPIYAPPLVIEVLSPSNRRPKIAAQRTAAFAAGTHEFWIVDTVERSIQVFNSDKREQLYAFGESVPVAYLPSHSLPISDGMRRPVLSGRAIRFPVNALD